MPQATSTFSMARRNSAFASVNVLPFSIVIRRLSSSRCSSSNIFNLKSGWMRSSGGVRRQSGNAAAAASIAAFTSATPASGTFPKGACVAGLTSSCHSVELELTHSPPMKCGMRMSETAVAHIGSTSTIVKGGRGKRRYLFPVKFIENYQKPQMRDSDTLKLKIIVQQRVRREIRAKFVESFFVKRQR